MRPRALLTCLFRQIRPLICKRGALMEKTGRQRGKEEEAGGKKEEWVKTADKRQQERRELSGGGRKEGSKGSSKDS